MRFLILQFLEEILFVYFKRGLYLICFSGKIQYLGVLAKQMIQILHEDKKIYRKFLEGNTTQPLWLQKNIKNPKYRRTSDILNMVILLLQRD